jgi:hypothetical protein
MKKVSGYLKIAAGFIKVNLDQIRLYSIVQLHIILGNVVQCRKRKSVSSPISI